MLRSSWLFALLAAGSVLAEHEDVADSILQAVGKKFGSPYSPYFVITAEQQIAHVNTKFSIFMNNGKMSVNNMTRTGDVSYVTDDLEATFKFPARMGVGLRYSYSLKSGSNQLSTGSASGTWVLSATLEVSTSGNGCQFKVIRSSKTDSFDLHLKPVQGMLYPLTVHFPPGDVIENKVLDTFNKNLNSSLDGWNVCDIVNCDLDS